MKKLFMAGAILFSSTIVFAYPQVNIDEIKTHQLEMIQKEKECLQNSKTLEEFKNCKFEAMKEFKLKMLDKREACIKNAKDMRDLRSCNMHMGMHMEMHHW